MCWQLLCLLEREELSLWQSAVAHELEAPQRALAACHAQLGSIGVSLNTSVGDVSRIEADVKKNVQASPMEGWCGCLRGGRRLEPSNPRLSVLFMISLLAVPS